MTVSWKNLPKSLMDELTLPSGHCEAFHDAFARLHRCLEKMSAPIKGRKVER